MFLKPLSIVIRGDWLWKAANINDKNNSAAVYAQSIVKVHNPLFSVGKLYLFLFIFYFLIDLFILINNKLNTSKKWQKTEKKNYKTKTKQNKTKLNK